VFVREQYGLITDRVDEMRSDDVMYKTAEQREMFAPAGEFWVGVDC
jgi:hypothetical protein